MLKLDIHEQQRAKQHQSVTSDLVLFDGIHNQVVADASTSKSTSDTQRMQEEILNGAILQVVFHNAIEQVPSDVNFRLEFIRLVNDSSLASLEKLKENILSSCLRDFPENEDLHCYKAVRPLESLNSDSNQDCEIVEQRTMKSFKKSVQELGTLSMRNKFIDWIVVWANSVKRSNKFVQHAEEALRWLAFDNFEEGGAKIACTCVHFVKRHKGYQSALNLVVKLIAKWKEVGSDKSVSWADLWLLYVNLFLHIKSAGTKAKTEGNNNIKCQRDSYDSAMLSAKKIILSGLQSVSTARDKYLLDQYLLQLLLGTSTVDSTELHQVYHEALARQEEDSDIWHSLRDQYLKWIFATKSFEELEAAAKTFMTSNRLLPTENTYKFLLQLIHMKMTYSCNQKTSTSICKIFEKLVDLFGQQNQQVWAKYIQFHVQRGEIVEANKVFHRATRAIPTLAWTEGYGIANSQGRDG